MTHSTLVPRRSFAFTVAQNTSEAQSFRTVFSVAAANDKMLMNNVAAVEGVALDDQVDLWIKASGVFWM